MRRGGRDYDVPAFCNNSHPDPDNNIHDVDKIGKNWKYIFVRKLTITILIPHSK